MVNYIFPFKKKACTKGVFVEFGWRTTQKRGFLYRLTAEKILVINDLGTNTQGPPLQRGKKCFHLVTARALQLLLTFK